MWQIILGVGIIFLLLEIFAPSMFFLNFALSALICAIVSVFFDNIVFLIVLFCVLSVIFILSLRPIFLKKIYKKDEKTGIEEKYIGKTAKVIENTDKNYGIISIYDERWQARNIEEGIIEAGQIVEIVGIDSIIMKVKKVN